MARKDTNHADRSCPKPVGSKAVTWLHLEGLEEGVLEEVGGQGAELRHRCVDLPQCQCHRSVNLHALENHQFGERVWATRRVDTVRRSGSSSSSLLSVQVLEGPCALSWVIHESMSLKYEPASEPLHISVGREAHDLISHDVFIN